MKIKPISEYRIVYKKPGYCIEKFVKGYIWDSWQPLGRQTSIHYFSINYYKVFKAAEIQLKIIIENENKVKREPIRYYNHLGNKV